MSKVTITGEAVVLTSSLKLDEIATIEKYRPEALRLYEGDPKEMVFAIGTTTDHGDIGKFGASFGKTAADGSGYATITMLINAEDGENIKEKVADFLGSKLLKLNKIEEQAPAALHEIEAEKAAILSNITLA